MGGRRGDVADLAALLGDRMGSTVRMPSQTPLALMSMMRSQTSSGTSLDRIAGYRDAGIVHQHVHRAEACNHRCKRAPSTLPNPVHPTRFRSPRRRLDDLGRGLVRRRNVETDDFAAGRPETQRRRLSDAAAGPGDDRDLPRRSRTSRPISPCHDMRYSWRRPDRNSGRKGALVAQLAAIASRRMPSSASTASVCSPRSGGGILTCCGVSLNFTGKPIDLTFSSTG